LITIKKNEKISSHTIAATATAQAYTSPRLMNRAASAYTTAIRTTCSNTWFTAGTVVSRKPI
jgi:hypothetical protein